MTLWIKHTKAERIALLQRAEEMFGINQIALEKDCWVTMVLNALFKCSCAQNMIFKGGTSLSKGWGLIERFSEDIDLSVDHTFFEITKTTKNQREKLRKKARRYFLDVLSQELDTNLREIGAKGFDVENVVDTVDDYGNTMPLASDKDPTAILVHYDSILKIASQYIPPRVKIEIGCLSINEPTEDRLISSYVEQATPGEDNSSSCYIRTVTPSRTFLEKTFLLCEEFQKDKPRYKRMSRHLYDIERLMDSQFSKQALEDKDLYERIVRHRSIYYSVGYVDYSKLEPDQIVFIPPKEVIPDWKSDYTEMCNQFIYGDKLTFDELLDRLCILQNRFRNIQ